MEVKRAHAVRNQAIRTLRNSSKTDLELSRIPDLRDPDGISLHDSQQGSSRAKQGYPNPEMIMKTPLFGLSENTPGF